MRFRHMNECRIFHNIHSITFLLYTFHIYLSSFIRTIYIINQNIILAYQPKNCCKFKITFCHLVFSYIFKTTPNSAKVKMMFGIGCDVSKQTLTLTRTWRHFPVFLSCISYKNLHYYPLNLFVKATVQRLTIFDYHLCNLYSETDSSGIILPMFQ